eukprot:scaffold231737_cov30-Tisochrysis_lutea.AAC.1
MKTSFAYKLQLLHGDAFTVEDELMRMVLPKFHVVSNNERTQSLQLDEFKQLRLKRRLARRCSFVQYHKRRRSLSATAGAGEVEASDCKALTLTSRQC